jgi:plasmid stabilization system protein ParE
MKATLLVPPRAETDLQDLHPRDLCRIVETMEFLCDFPGAAQSAGFDEAPQVRRAVAGEYLIYYRFDVLRNALVVLRVIHGRRQQLILSDVVEG